MRRAQHREPKLRTVARTSSARIDALDDDVQTIVYNERITRARVDTIEAFFAMSWHERLWWVVTGRSKYFTVTALVDAVSAPPDAAEVAAATDPASQALGVGA